MPEADNTIALFIPNLEPAGAERVTVLLANGLVQRGRSVDVVLVQATGSFLADLAAEVHVVDLRAERALRAIPSLASYLRKRRPAAVVAALEHANFAAIAARRLSCTATPVISAVHNSQAAIAQRFPGLRGALFSACVNWSYRRAEAVVCVSQGVAEDVVHTAGVARERVRIIYNPVIHPHMQELARQPVEHPWLAPSARSPAGPRLLLAAGRLRPQKDFPTLLRAVKIVRERLDARLIVLGEGEERPRLECLVKELGLEQCVDMPGIAKNPYAYMARADLFVLSSAWEALPTVLIEALAAGAPVVATDCVSGPREVLADGRYGALVPVGDAAALAAAISAAVSAPRRELPPEALRPYTIDHAVEQYCQVVAEVTHG
jgi:glycosyltransferase involved in cell wall biosynthesis